MEPVNPITRRYREKALFGGNREKAIIRDGERCVRCGMTREEHRAKYGRDITVDHIDGNGVHTPKESKNNNLDNLQTLCTRCHGRKDMMRRKGLRAIRLTEEDVRDIRMFHKAGMRGIDIHKCYPMVADSTIWAAIRGQYWKEIETHAN